MKKPIQWTCLGLLVAIFTLCSTHVSAQTNSFPKKPITVIFPFARGTDSENVAKDLLPVLSKYLRNTPINLDYKGDEGLPALMAAKPDGYTLSLGRLSNLLIAPILNQNLQPYWEKAAIIGIIDLQPVACFVTPEYGINNIHKLADKIRANPGQVKYATGGPGGVLFYVYLLRLLGLKHDSAKPFYVKNVSEAISLMSTGNIDFACSTIPPIVEYLNKKAIIPILTNGHRPLDNHLDMQTIQQLGLKELARFQTWTALLAPPGTPNDVVKVLRNALIKASDDPEWAKSSTLVYAANGIKTISNPSEFIRDQASFYENIAILSRLVK